MSKATIAQPVVCGVYLLFKDRKLTYVGKSVDCYGRINAHRVNGREFDYATVAACPEADMGWVEAALIAAMEPVGNRAGKAKPVVLPTLRELAPRPVHPSAPEDPMMSANMNAANRYCAAFGLQGALKPAIASGELRAMKDGRTWAILWGDLKTWCEAKQNARFGGLAANGKEG
jgi:hypothetical protein